MALIPQAKCSRCDRKYSGLRTRCPYCGARRYAKSTRAVPNDNSMWKVIVGILLLVVLIVAVIVLIATSGNDTAKSPSSTGSGGVEDSVHGEDADPGQQGTEGGEGTEPDPFNVGGGEGGGDTPGSGEGSGEGGTSGEDQTPTVQAQSVIIVNATNGRRTGVYNKDLDIYEASFDPGDKYNFDYKVTPDGVTSTAVWESSNESVASILQTGEMTAVGPGYAYITVTIDGVSDTFLVRVRK